MNGKTKNGTWVYHENQSQSDGEVKIEETQHLPLYMRVNCADTDFDAINFFANVLADAYREE